MSTPNFLFLSNSCINLKYVMNIQHWKHNSDVGYTIYMYPFEQVGYNVKSHVLEVSNKTDYDIIKQFIQNGNHKDS